MALFMFLLAKVFTLRLSITRGEEIYLNVAAISGVEVFRDDRRFRDEKLIKISVIDCLCLSERRGGRRASDGDPSNRREKLFSLGTFAIINMLCC